VELMGKTHSVATASGIDKNQPAQSEWLLCCINVERTDLVLRPLPGGMNEHGTA
jgi:hypothetical protein